VKYQPLNLVDLADRFPDDDSARAFLEGLRWPDGPVCPHCGSTDVLKLIPRTPESKTRKGLYKCRSKECRKQFTVTVGTIFEASHIPLRKWLMAIHLLCASKKGMSAHQMHRMLGVTYKTAWFMCHRIRYAMTQEPLASKLTGTVEVDETYVGGKVRGTGRGRIDKPPVVALVERGGEVRAFHMPRVTEENLREAIRKHVDPSARVMTDSHYGYTHVDQDVAEHQTVTHTQNEWVRGDVHTQTVEGYFSLLKRGIVGTYHHVGDDHLDRYVNEFTFRYNNRKVSDGTRTVRAIKGAEGKRLMLKEPTG
jgi:transposase-like protein